MLSRDTLSIIGIIIYFILLLTVVLRAKRSSNLEDYFLGGRRLSFWMIALSFIASWWGAGSALATANMAYSEGISAYWIYGMPVLFSTLLIIAMSKAIRRIPAMTQSKMLTLRYGRLPALILSIIVLMFMTITTASQIVGIGDFFMGYLNIDYTWGVILGTGIVLVYSLFGGFRAVVITDIVQFIFLAFSTVTIFIIAWVNAGGWSEIVAQTESVHRPEILDFTAHLSHNIVYVITFGAAWMIQANVWQRISASKNSRDARRMAQISLVVFIVLYGMAVMTGVSGFVLFDTLPKGGIIPGIIEHYVHPLLGTLIFIGICSAIMSTMDSLINTGALVLTHDIYREYIHPGAKDKQLVTVSLIATTFITVFAVLIALRIRSILHVSWIAADVLATGCFVPLVFGFFWRRGTTQGALYSMIWGLSYSLYFLLIQFGVNLYVPFKEGSAEQILVGISISFLIYIVVSFLTKPQYEQADIFISLSKKELNDLPR